MGDDFLILFRLSILDLVPGGSTLAETIDLAQQLEPIHRRVALKVVKLGMDTAQVLARFHNERHALGFRDNRHAG